MKIVRIGGQSRELPSAEEVGAKATNLARMAALGLPVPPAFVLPVRLCADVVAGKAHATRNLRDGLAEGIAFLEQATGKSFGDSRKPLLVSVRSGAARSMPGMLDTVLNVGCTSTAVRGLIRGTGRPHLAWDCRRRFLECYAETVAGLDPAPFEARLNELIAAEGVESDRDLDSEALERLASDERKVLEDDDDGWLEDAGTQLERSARAVYRSWMSERAQTYRQLERLGHLHGTAVTVQAMVFGNGSPSSGAGVAFSRDPSTGAPAAVIDVLFDAQGEDVVSGRRTPDTEAALARVLPAIADELRSILKRLEQEFREVQDVEFTIENGKLWILQTRSAKRTPRAALRIAIDLVHEGLITREQARETIAGIDLATLVETSLLPAQPAITAGIGASGGIAVGRATFDSGTAQRLAATGDPVILMRPDTSTADIAGFAAAAGIVTAAGGRTAHASLVARQMGKPCLVGCRELRIDTGAQRAQIGQAVIAAGDWVTVDANEGCVYLGRGDIVTRRPEAELAEVSGWQQPHALKQDATS
ncbi:pyruvate, phosphate dikinase [Bradyrhizobium viridifuturi]|jgi:pyruvate, orthophosphate dikinase|nr:MULTISPECIES: PEP/pyruvate-binding domain-containing protein [Bradyrhizobium]ERF82347.1 MAG: pyruvate, phosphate dikinase [Bradyrhizobium sp. DFCI-1]OYU60925.1 MAG: pyruvate, phosphate dikinase [Bradyrhizobium sp. PARBB1]PSO22626.1 pyruvate, phosphate dikinase [Bradyrhizobium sp. MOS004]QRI68815.1 pyruvate, phosphate dikinase [Bradyrhizobium sp. PSBB068]MBR1020793.1 pyruvate, phosphate dikinase [Bradyrhizobium viridifuturi]